jgi:hypothetical protein
MKAVVAFVLVVIAAAYYLGYSPSDLTTAFQSQPTPAAKRNRGNRAPAPQPAPAVAAAEQPRNTTIVTVPGPDGSLEHRWSHYPATPPKR